MGDVVDLFPAGEPDGEKPMTGYCTTCGSECSWPNDMSAWPESCPRGCTPFSVQDKPLDYFGWITAQGPPVPGIGVLTMTEGPHGRIDILPGKGDG